MRAYSKSMKQKYVTVDIGSVNNNFMVTKQNAYNTGAHLLTKKYVTIRKQCFDEYHFLFIFHR